jgi:hypothetical protein
MACSSRSSDRVPGAAQLVSRREARQSGTQHDDFTAWCGPWNPWAQRRDRRQRCERDETPSHHAWAMNNQNTAALPGDTAPRK